SRSGVNWIREWLACTVAATARAREVLPVPGKSSSSRCPPESRQVRVSRTTWSLPSTAAETLPTRRVKVSANQAAWSGVTGACCAVVGALMNSFPEWSAVGPGHGVFKCSARAGDDDADLFTRIPTHGTGLVFSVHLEIRGVAAPHAILAGGVELDRVRPGLEVLVVEAQPGTARVLAAVLSDRVADVLHGDTRRV